MRHPKTKNIFRSLFFFFLLAPLGFATETRMDSAGGLSLVLADESVELNPFLFGNPAGLSFLETKNRFDLDGHWLLQSSAATGASNSFYGTVSDPFSTASNYHGLILAPSKNWALQLDGDILHTENQPDFGVRDKTRDRSRELFRTAFKMEGLSIGGQVQATQISLALNPGNFYGAQLHSGQGTGSGLQGTGGLLLSFPSAPLAQQDRIVVGGMYSREIIPGRAKTDMILEVPGPVTVSLSQTLEGSNVQSFGPEFYFESPNSLQAVLLGRISNGEVSLQQDSSDPVIPNLTPYKYQSANAVAVLAALKTNSPLQRLTSLKSGVSFLFQSSKTTNFDPTQTVTIVSDIQGWQFQIGTGLEGLEKYTVGFQAKLQGASGSLQPAAGPVLPENFFSYQLSLGGEQWLSKEWAFRAGIFYENNINTGTSAVQSRFIPVPGGQRIVATTVTAGIGYKSPQFKSDLLFLLGQPSVYDSPNPDDFMTQIGIQLSVSVLFE